MKISNMIFGLVVAFLIFAGITYAFFLHQKKVKDREVFTSYISKGDFNTFVNQSAMDRISARLKKKTRLDSDEQLFVDKIKAQRLYWKALMSKDFNERIVLFRRCLEINGRHPSLTPQNYQIYIDMAESYLTEKMDDMAIKYFENAINMCPQKSKAYLSKAVYYYRNNNDKEAEKLYKKVIELNEENIEAQFWLGQLYFLQCRYPEAKFQFNKVILIDPKYSDAYVALGRVYFFGEKNYEEAKAHLNKALEIDPKN